MSEKEKPAISKDPASVKQALIILGIIAVYFVITLLPTPSGLTYDGQKAIALMVCVVLAWATQVVPLIISSIFFIFLSYAVGITTPTGGAIKDFATPTIFFMFVSILLAYAMDRCGMNQRLALKMTVLSRGNPKAMIFILIAGTAGVSSIIANVPSCAAFFPIVLALCKKNDCVKGKSNFAKASIIGIIFGAMVGGSATPAGTPINIMALDLLEASGHDRLSFAQWSMLGIPLVVIIIPLIWLILITVFPPEFKKLAGLDESKKELAELGKFSVQEIKFMALAAVMLFLWFTEGILHSFDTTTVLTFIATLMFFPGIRLLEYEYVRDKLDWTIIIMTGASIAFGATMFSSGASKWIADISLGSFVGLNPLLLVIIISVFTAVIHILIPSCPALVSVLIPTLAAFAAESNIPVMLLFLPAAFNVSTYWLMPFDPLPMMCYPEKYFSIKDFFKAGLPAHIALVGVTAAVVMLIAKPFGYF